MGESVGNIHVIVGEDDYLVERTAKKWRDAAVPVASQGSAVEIVDGEAESQDAQMASLRSCEASVQSPPFLDPVKLTWWKNVTFLPGGGRGGVVAERIKTALERFAADLMKNPLPPNQFLVITAPKLLKTSIFAKTLASVAEVVAFAAAKRPQDRIAAAVANLPELAEDERLSFAPGAAEAFVAKVGADTRTLLSELAKMRTYLGEGEHVVTTEAIGAITSASGAEPELWTLTDAVGRRNMPLAARRLGEFLGQKGAGIMLSTVLAKFFRDLCVYRDAMDRGWLTPHGWARALPAEAAATLDAAGIGPNAEKRSWIVRNSAAAARNYQPRELRAARFRLERVREALVSGGADDAALVTELLRIVPAPRR